MTTALPPRGRLILSGLVTIVGGVLALGAVQATWTVVETPGGLVRTEQGRFQFPDLRTTEFGIDAAPGALVASVVLIVAALAAWLVGPRLRVALYAICGLAALGILAGAHWGPDTVLVPPGAHATATAMRGVTTAGGLVALAGSATALTVAHRVPRLRMPESAPTDP